MSSLNLADHLKASAEITSHINDGDALAKKLGAILSNARTTLETLRAFAPADRFKVDIPYYLRGPNGNNEGSMSDIIKRLLEGQRLQSEETRQGDRRQGDGGNDPGHLFP